MEGSSAEITSNPPCAPVIAELTKGSAATFSPSCFMDMMARLPQNDIPKASSNAVFSLDDQWEWMPRDLATSLHCTNSRISVEGVPGEAV